MKTYKKTPSVVFWFNISRYINGIILMWIFLIQMSAIGQNNEKTCVDCHKRTVKKEILHGPAADCTSCHKPNGKKHPIEDVVAFTYLEEGANLCFSCHEEEKDVIIKKKYLHKPVAKNECSECHEIHSSNDPKFIFAKPPDLCYFCHDEIEKSIEKSTLVHSPATDSGGCIICHSPHSSNRKKLLVSNGRELCLSCHDKTITVGERKITNIDKLLKESRFEHEALEKSCNACHDPHASNYKYLLTTSYPTGNYAKGSEEIYEMCFGCHDPDLLLAERTEYATEFRDGDKNLHFLHVNREKGRTCNNCHSLHGSSRKYLIPETVKYGKWDMPLVFKKFENGGSCKGCHREKRYTR